MAECEHGLDDGCLAREREKEKRDLIICFIIRVRRIHALVSDKRNRRVRKPLIICLQSLVSQTDHDGI